jgi:hypothetical protein
MTGMYNVLAKLRTGEQLDDEDRRTHEQGLVAVMRDIHDELDAAVLEADGWPANITTEDILFRLVELNTARQAEERCGKIRWLRPEFQQSPELGQTDLEIEIEEPVAARCPWPPLCQNACEPSEGFSRMSCSRSTPPNSLASSPEPAAPTFRQSWTRSYH